MKNKWIIFLIVFLFSAADILADVSVKGYYRRDGTYVRPHYRSSPDSTKSNNYGPSKNDFELMNPKTRDNDKDGIPNYRDNDDDNDYLNDDTDSSQYGSSQYGWPKKKD